MAKDEPFDGCVRLLTDLEIMELRVREKADDMSIDPYRMQNPDGTLVLAPILTARANLRAAMLIHSAVG